MLTLIAPVLDQVRGIPYHRHPIDYGVFRGSRSFGICSALLLFEAHEQHTLLGASWLPA